jgi:predicted xylose isomerase-like sugar epimerase
MKVYLFTPIFKEGIELDGQIVYAKNERQGLKEMKKFFDDDDLEGVEVLGWTTTDDPDYQHYLEFS